MEDSKDTKNNLSNAEKTQKCEHCNREIPKDAKICPHCGKNISILFCNERTPTTLKIRVKDLSNLHAADVIALGKNEVENAFKAGVLTQPQKTMLLSILDSANDLEYGKKKVLIALIIELAHAIDSSSKREHASLLKHYLSTIGTYKEMMDALSQSFGLN
jgi:predicted RNA-binding Zn-ribbon protein involved in translation (DUF1610 family)